MRIMAIDYGDARTGVAISDPTGLLAGYTTVIQSRKEGVVAEELARLAKEHSVDELVMGFPRNMDGTEGPRAELYRAFAARLEEVCGLILSRAFSTEGGYIQFTIVPHSDGTVAIHLRDNARAFNPFEVNTDAISLEDGTGLDAIGIKMVKRKAKEFFYRRYAGFNTMVVRI